MNILQICSAKNFGGGEKHLIELSSGLNAVGHKMFFAMRRKNDWQKKLEKFEAKNIFNLPLRNAFDLQSAWQMAKIIRENSVEIVHAHVARDYPLAVFAAALAGNDARVVLTRHVLFPLKSLHKFLLRNVSAVIAVSRAVEKQLKQQKIFSADKIKFVSNAINFENKESAPAARENSFRRRFRIKPDEFLITTIGTLNPLKGYDDFLRSAAPVSEKFQNARFAIVGKDGSAKGEYKKHLVELAEKLDLHRRILWIDSCDEVSEVLSETDVFVSASHTESFGLAVYEAMAAGCAVVATETEGAKELIRHGENGKLAPIMNAEKIALAVNEFLASENCRQSFGAAARKTAQTEISFSEMINSTEKIYFQCLAENRQEKLSTVGEDSILPENQFASS